MTPQNRQIQQMQQQRMQQRMQQQRSAPVVTVPMVTAGGTQTMTQHETITMDGQTFHLWYQNLQQRQMAIEEYRQRKYGVMTPTVEDRQAQFNFMSDNVRETGTKFGMQ